MTRARALGFSGRKPPDITVALVAIAHDRAELHDAGTAQWYEHGVVERRAAGNIGTLDRKVIEHAKSSHVSQAAAIAFVGFGNCRRSITWSTSP